MIRCMKCSAELHVRSKCLMCGWEPTVPVDRTLPDVSNLSWVAWGRTRANRRPSDARPGGHGIPAWSLRLTATETAAVQSRRADAVERQL